MQDIPVITVDGPSGSGKGTLSYMLAKELGWVLLDSGALYRLLALAADLESVAIEDESALVALTQVVDFTFTFNQDQQCQALLNQKDVTAAIRTEKIGYQASRLAAYPAVRAALLDKQRDFRKLPGLVADGRDMGTVVFPTAALKFFLKASAQERAKRRFLQLKSAGQNVKLESIFQAVVARDQRDGTRAVAPLVASHEAIVIETDGLGIEAVYKHAMQYVRQFLLKT